jgi:hypothetical protein
MKANDVTTCPKCGGDLDEGSVHVFACGWRGEATWDTPDWRLVCWSRGRAPLVNSSNVMVRGLRCVQCSVVLLYADERQ